jgi:hypothetical protein
VRGDEGENGRLRQFGEKSGSLALLGMAKRRALVWEVIGEIEVTVRKSRIPKGMSYRILGRR